MRDYVEGSLGAIGSLVPDIVGIIIGARGADKAAKAGKAARGLDNVGNPKPGTLSNVEARQWYLEQEAKIGDMLDTSKSLEDQAKQAFELRNQFRTQARELMSDRETAESLYKTDPNMTWEEIVNKYKNEGFVGDSLWQEIIDASTRSRSSVNQNLGLE